MTPSARDRWTPEDRAILNRSSAALMQCEENQAMGRYGSGACPGQTYRTYRAMRTRHDYPGRFWRQSRWIGWED